MSEFPDNKVYIQGTEKGMPFGFVPEVKPPTCKISLLSSILLISLVPLLILLIIFGKGETSDTFVNIIGCIMLFCFISSPILAVIATIRIALSDGRLGGMSRAYTVIVGSSILLVFVGGPSVSMDVSKIAQRVVCGTNLKGLGTAFVVYAQDNDDQLPISSRWCDLLIMEADVSPKSFVCRASETIEGESSYVLNQFAVGKKLSELPSNMILLFETNQGKSDSDRNILVNERKCFQKYPDLLDQYSSKHFVFNDRWNQVGGPEIMAMNHKYGINITYADGHSEFVRLQYPENIMELERFRWDIEGTQFPLSAYKALNDSIQAPPSFPKSIIGLGIVTFVVGVILLYTGQAWKHPSFALILAVGASVVGFVFGGWGESLYRPEYFKGIGTYGGAALGFLAGLCYVGILTKLQLRFKIRTSVNQLALSLGIASGLLCSALLHLALAIAHHNYFIIMLGIPFGILGGAVLGSISGWILMRQLRLSKAV